MFTEKEFKDGEECSPGCANHVTHPCEKCGRIQARTKKIQEFNHFRFILARHVRGLTQEELASKLEISTHEVWQLENCAIKPDSALFEKICKVLDFPENFFFELGGIYPGQF